MLTPIVSCLDLAHPTEEQLCHLDEACDCATFGRNQEDVLDETYRKAGKMDKGDFLVDFSPPEFFLGLVRDELLQRHDTRLVYDLYKLNVYGECHIVPSSASTQVRCAQARIPSSNPIRIRRAGQAFTAR